MHAHTEQRHCCTTDIKRQLAPIDLSLYLSLPKSKLCMLNNSIYSLYARGPGSDTLLSRPVTCSTTDSDRHWWLHVAQLTSVSVTLSDTTADGRHINRPDNMAQTTKVRQADNLQTIYSAVCPHIDRNTTNLTIIPRSQSPSTCIVHQFWHEHYPFILFFSINLH